MPNLANTFAHINKSVDNIGNVENDIKNGGPLGGPRLFPFRGDQVDSVATPTFSGASTIAGGVVIGDEDYTKYQLQSAIADYMTLTSGFQRSLAPSGLVTPTVRSFIYTGQTFEIDYRTLSSSFRVLVDGVLISQFQTTSTNMPDFALFDTGNIETKRIDIIAKGEYWGGLVIESGSVITPTRDEQPVICVIGDSYTGGTGSTFNNIYSSILMTKLNTYDVAAFGIGGSGYTAGGAGNVFIDRLTEVTDRNPDYLIFAGGQNDAAAAGAVFQAAIDTCFDQALADGVLPSEIVILSPFFGRNASVDGLTIRDQLEAKALEIGAFFIDTLGDGTDGWNYGMGTEAAPTGGGNSDVTCVADGTHWTPYGHFYNADRLASEILKLSSKV